MMLPAVEKTRSQGTEVAGIAKYLRASLASLGYNSFFWRHQESGLSLLSIGGSNLYACSSCDATGIASLLAIDRAKKDDSVDGEADAGTIGGRADNSFSKVVQALKKDKNYV